MGFYSGKGVLRNPAISALAVMILGAGVYTGFKNSAGTAGSFREIVSCTGTGGLAKYEYCTWTEPSTNPGSGSVITKIVYNVGSSPVAVGVDATISDNATSSGSIENITNITNITTATGQTIAVLTGAYLVSEGENLVFKTLTDPTGSHTATVEVEYSARHSY